MSEFTRVRDKASGHKYTIATTVAETTDGLEILNEPATDPGGAPLPPEYAEAKKSASATSQKGS